ncbi:MAG: S9 family peptidase [Undibacterium sp.]|nr:S9 family peptidase [Undibacterium sp.]
MKLKFPLTLLLCSLFITSFTSLAQADSSIPVADFFKKPNYRGRPVLSPDGQNMAVLTPKGGHFVLSIINLDTRTPKVVASDANFDIVNPIWINNQRLLFSVARSGDVTQFENDGGGLFAVNKDGSHFRTLVVTMKDAIAGKPFKPYAFISSVGGDSDDIIAINNERGRDVELGASDLYKLDTMNGRANLLTFKNPGKVNSWLLDHHNTIRIANSMALDANKRVQQTVYYRANENEEWKAIYSAYLDEGKEMTPVSFDFDDKTLFVSGRFNGRDAKAIHVWDFSKQAAGEIIADAPNVDVGQLIQDSSQQKTIGAVVDGMKPEIIFFHEQYAQIQANLKASFPNQEVYFQLRGKRAVVTTTGVNNLGTVYFFDTEKKTLELIYTNKPELDGKKLSEQSTINYTARDGLNIPAYLTLPEGRTAKNLPLIAYIHGGPHARDVFGFDPITQMFASRGYAVFQPQFRMSTGFGWKHHTAGWKQWGLAMQDDITDGIAELVKQGIVDKNRICIVGGSYGGYATMYGLIKDPDLYKCGVNSFGVTDVKMLFSLSWTDVRGAYFDNIGTLMHGNPKTDEAYFHTASAIENAEKIKAPVLMIYGSDDVRVPLIHGEKMRDKLRSLGKPVDWMVMVGEGHGWAKESNQILWGETMLKFVDKHIGEGAATKSTAH